MTKSSTLRFNWHYFLAFVLLFALEVVIALYVHDSFVRPYLGDTIVVWLIYAFILSFFAWSKSKVALGVLLFAFLVEGLQAMHFIELIGLQDNAIARVVIGTSFAWEDIWAYIGGYLVIIIIIRFMPSEKR